MSTLAAPSEALSPRVLVLDNQKSHDVFDVLGAVDDHGILRVRSPFLFEIGEQLSIRIEQDGTVSEATAKVRAHIGPDEARITELEIFRAFGAPPDGDRVVLVGELDEVDYNLEVDGEVVRRTVARKVFERGAWATVAVAYDERGRDGAWKPTKLALIRLQKVRDAWKSHGTVTLSAGDALELARSILEWNLPVTTGDDDR